MGERKRRLEYLKALDIDGFIATLPEVTIIRYRYKTMTGLEASKLIKGSFKNTYLYKIKIPEKVNLDHKVLFSRIIFDNKNLSFDDNCKNYLKLIDNYLSKLADNEKVTL